MKKIVLLALIVLLLSNYTIAQTAFRIGGKFSYPLYTRIHNPQVDNAEDNIQQYDEASTICFGLMAGIKIVKRFGITAELLYSDMIQNYKGASLEQGSAQAYKSFNRIKSFDVPIMFEYGKYIYAEIGPVFSFLLDADFEQTIASIKNKNDVTEKFSRYNWGGAIGFGINMPIKLVEITLGTRYTLGLRDFKGVDGLGIDVLEKTTTHALGAHIAVKIKLN